MTLLVVSTYVMFEKKGRRRRGEKFFKVHTSCVNLLRWHLSIVGQTIITTVWWVLFYIRYKKMNYERNVKNLNQVTRASLRPHKHLNKWNVTFVHTMRRELKWPCLFLLTLIHTFCTLEKLGQRLFLVCQFILIGYPNF